MDTQILDGQTENSGVAGSSYNILVEDSLMYSEPIPHAMAKEKVSNEETVLQLHGAVLVGAVYAYLGRPAAAPAAPDVPVASESVQPARGTEVPALVAS